MMTPEQLTELLTLAKAATPGPYETDTIFAGAEVLHEVPLLMQGHGISRHIAYGTTFSDLEQEKANFEFFKAASPDAVCEMVERVRVAEQALEQASRDVFYAGNSLSLLTHEQRVEHYLGEARTALNLPEEGEPT